MRIRGSMAMAAIGLVGLAGLARAGEPTVLERVASVKRDSEGSSARLLDTPVLQVLRAEEERTAEGQRESLRVASTPLFSVFQQDSTTGANGGKARREGKGRFASVFGVSLLAWSSASDHGLGGQEEASESEVRIVDVPLIGPLFARRQTPEGSGYDVLFFLHLGQRGKR